MRNKTTCMYMQEQSVWGLMGMGGVIVGFYSNIKGHPQDTIRVTVSEYTICSWLHHCSLQTSTTYLCLISDCVCLTQ